MRGNIPGQFALQWHDTTILPKKKIQPLASMGNCIDNNTVLKLGTGFYFLNDLPDHIPLIVFFFKSNHKNKILQSIKKKRLISFYSI